MRISPQRDKCRELHSPSELIDSWERERGKHAKKAPVLILTRFEAELVDRIWGKDLKNDLKVIYIFSDGLGSEKILKSAAYEEWNYARGILEYF